ncbi:helix-turn-helix transcriptional regulator [Desulfoferula mesophila]|uniref:HTH cro/C1-type domain-containing protein n=1 Tax=Desulfoferula mesophila TaxID=3058419 RepID=A0AAU9EKE2_9BACT|nr:hypothetical protein FAK_15220 [Desulfoferula mesophilus]
MRDSHTLIAAWVGRRLKQLRGERTQQEFADLLGLSQAQYNRYETGKRLAHDKVLEQVAQVCGLSPEQVIWGDELPAEAGSRLEAAREFAALLDLLDDAAKEDIFVFLKHKAEELARQRRAEARQALKALEGFAKKALG